KSPKPSPSPRPPCGATGATHARGSSAASGLRAHASRPAEITEGYPVATPSPNFARELYERALRLPRGDRDDFLRQACGADTEALRAAQRLLASHTIAESFLETSNG